MLCTAGMNMTCHLCLKPSTPGSAAAVRTLQDDVRIMLSSKSGLGCCITTTAATVRSMHAHGQMLLKVAWRA